MKLTVLMYHKIDALPPGTRHPGSYVRPDLQLAALLGRAPDVFAYPYSNQHRDVRRLVRAAGYRAAVRGKGRMNRRHTDPFGLRRIKVEPEWTADDLRRKLAVERMRIF